MANIAPPGGPQSAGTQLNIQADDAKRDVGLIGLMWASEGSIIGSGWLLGAFGATAIAGPSALFAWLIGSGIVLILALVHAELGGLFPVSGGTARFPHYAFGSLAGASFGWFSWLQAAAVAPIEVEAALQYAAGNYSWAKGWVHTNHTLTSSGLIIAILLLAVFVVANLLGVRWLGRLNSTITWWKIIVPVVAIIYLAFHFHSGNFTAGGGFFIHGSGGGWHAILTSFGGGGIVFAMLGFEQAVQLGGESRNPQRDMPRAVIGSMVIGSIVYVLLDLVFVGSIDPGKLAGVHSWTQLGDAKFLGHAGPYLNNLSNAPFVTVVKALGFGALASILLADAVISPSGTGLIYLTSTSRLSYGLSKNGYVPAVMEKTSRSKVPWVGLVVAYVLGIVMFAPFPSWEKLVNFITSASVLMYAGAPLALGALRMQKPDLARAYRVPAGRIVAPVSFILANYLIFWSGWQTDWRLGLAVLIGYAVMGVSIGFRLNPRTPSIDWHAAIWLFPYLIGMMILSFVGTYGGGRKELPFGWDFLVIAVFSVVIYSLAMKFRLPEHKVDEYVRDVYPPPVAE